MRTTSCAQVLTSSRGGANALTGIAKSAIFNARKAGGGWWLACPSGTISSFGRRTDSVMDKREAAIVIEAVSHHLGWCGCGIPAAAADWLRRALEAHPAWEKQALQGAVWGEDQGRAYVLRYMLDHAALTEHGGSVGGAWLTERGKRVLAALQVPGAIRGVER